MKVRDIVAVVVVGSIVVFIHAASTCTASAYYWWWCRVTVYLVVVMPQPMVPLGSLTSLFTMRLSVLHERLVMFQQ